MSAPLKAYMELRGYGSRGPRYQVRMNSPDGIVIIETTTEPLFAAARLLHSQGIGGKLQLWDSARPFPRLQGDIERLAAWTIAEDQHGIRVRRYEERVTGGDFEDEAPEGAQIEDGRPERPPQASRAIEVAA